MHVSGPVPANSVFHMARIGRYDAVLSLYHDQGHIAAKMMDFEKTVSVTLGLPILRTSVDHGTAFDIAGTGKASAVSMIEAVRSPRNTRCAGSSWATRCRRRRSNRSRQIQRRPGLSRSRASAPRVPPVR